MKNPFIPTGAVADGWVMFNRLPYAIRRQIEVQGPDGLQIELEWDGAYSVISQGGVVVVVPDSDHLKGFLEAAFGMPVAISGDKVVLTTWARHFQLCRKPALVPQTSPDDSYW